MITPAIKDKLLRYLIAQEQIDLEIDFHDLYEQTGIRFDLANMILEHFDRRGLILYQGYIGGCCINLKAEIFDFSIMEVSLLKKNFFEPTLKN